MCSVQIAAYRPVNAKRPDWHRFCLRSSIISGRRTRFLFISLFSKIFYYSCETEEFSSVYESAKFWELYNCD